MDPWQMDEAVVLGMREAIGGGPLSEPFRVRSPCMVRIVVSVNADGLPGKEEIIFQSFYVYLHLCVARRGMASSGMVPLPNRRPDTASRVGSRALGRPPRGDGGAVTDSSSMMALGIDTAWALGMYGTCMVVIRW